MANSTAPAQASNELHPPLDAPQLSPEEAKVDAELARLRDEILMAEESLDGADAEQLIKAHQELLHVYNQRKDAANAIIAKLAQVERVRHSELLDRLGLSKLD